MGSSTVKNIRRKAFAKLFGYQAGDRVTIKQGSDNQPYIKRLVGEIGIILKGKKPNSLYRVKVISEGHTVVLFEDEMELLEESEKE